MLRRCNDWDYRQPCIYQITLVLATRASKALGRLVMHSGSAESAKIELSQVGNAVLREWQSIGNHHPEVKPLFMQVMPDHVHGILRVLKPMAKPLGNVIGGFKAGSSKAAIGSGGLWAPGFQDSILFRDGQLEAMFEYLRDNPRRLAIKKLMPDLFRVRREVGVNLMLPHQAQHRSAWLVGAAAPYSVRGAAAPRSAPGAEAPCAVRGAEAPCPAPGAAAPCAVRGAEAPCSVRGAEAPRPPAFFSAIGNMHLLDAPNIIQVQCSRSYFSYKRRPKPGGGRKIAVDESKSPIPEIITPQFEEMRDQLIAAAKRGAVLISPAISDGEREIARLAHEAGARVIVLKNMGFSPLYKPGGKLFDKTANGKLLLLAPIAWQYSSQDKPMTRQNACVLNRLAQLIAGEGAAEINYKGMKPADIDTLVLKAVTKP